MTPEQQAAVFKALGHPARLAMVERIALGECCVWELKELAETFRLSAPTVSQRLLVLKHSEIIGEENRGTKVFHQLLIRGAAGIAF